MVECCLWLTLFWGWGGGGFFINRNGLGAALLSTVWLRASAWCLARGHPREHSVVKLPEQTHRQTEAHTQTHTHTHRQTEAHRAQSTHRQTDRSTQSTQSTQTDRSTQSTQSTEHTHTLLPPLASAVSLRGVRVWERRVSWQDFKLPSTSTTPGFDAQLLWKLHCSWPALPASLHFLSLSWSSKLSGLKW